MIIFIIISDNSVPIKIDPLARVEEINKSEAERIPTHVEPPKETKKAVVTESSRVNSADKLSESTIEKRRHSLPTKRKSNCPNLLGQLNVDKKYLQDLLKCLGKLNYGN